MNLLTSQNLPPVIAPQGARRLDYLDSIRGLAAMAVAFGHFVAAFGVPPGWEWLNVYPFLILQDGSGAVSLFFVLSGFVLARKFLKPAKAEPPSDSLLQFYGQRWLRIYPPYLIAVLLSYVLYRYWFYWPPMDPLPTANGYSHWGPWIQIRDTMKEALFLNPEARALLLPHRWTLTLELKFSVLIPFLVIIAKRSAIWLGVFGMLAWLMFGVPSWIIHFSLGVLLAKLQPIDADPRRLIQPRWALVIFFIGFLLYGAAGYVGKFGIGPEHHREINGLGSAILLAGVLLSYPLQNFLNLWLLRFIGRISYSFYLLHFIALYCFAPPLFSFLGGHGMWRWSIVLALTFVGLTILSVIFYRTVELPSIALGRWLTRKIAQREARFAAAKPRGGAATEAAREEGGKDQ